MSSRTSVLHLRVPDYVIDAVDSYAQRRGVKRSAAICVLITRQLETQGELPLPERATA